MNGNSSGEKFLNFPFFHQTGAFGAARWESSAIDALLVTPSSTTTVTVTMWIKRFTSSSASLRRKRWKLGR